jgi:protein SCO1/2
VSTPARVTRGHRKHGGAARTTLILAMVPLVLIGVGVLIALMFSGGMRGSGSTGGVSSGIDASQDSAQNADVLASMVIPEFRAVDQSGTARDRSIFTRPGRYTVLNFVFTRCITVCPITTGQMIRVQEAIKEIPGGEAGGRFQLVSFSVDPTRDTPAALKAHAEGFADFTLWTFLTSDAETVKGVVERGLGFALEEEKGSRIDLGGGDSMSNIIHPSKLLLVSPEGKVVGMYRGLDEEDVTRLIERIKGISRERLGK